MTVAKISPNIVPTLPTPEVGLSDREVLLQTVLSPADYQFVKDTKLDELFAYDKETGKDGLRHILAGEVIGEQRIPKGFHHRGSGAEVSVPEPKTGEPSTQVVEIVDNEGKTANRPLMEPYLAKIKVDGQDKMASVYNRSTGERNLVPGHSTMFPDEYDALMIMRTVSKAIENADPALDNVRKQNGKWYYTLTGKVPLIDGKSEMAVKVVLNEDFKVTTAYPSMAHSERMNLTPEQATHHATYGLATATGSLALGSKGVNHG